MDELDRKIVRALQADGRLRIADLSERVGLSPTPCARRVAKLEESGVITGYRAEVNPAKLGLPLTVFIAVELERQNSADLGVFETAIARFPEVVECHLLTGSRDILLRVVAADLAAFDRFMEDGLMRVPGIRNLNSSFTLRTMIKRDVRP
ncbi:Lrp/AsnC family transcriptional regulator [Pseudoruegeria sp. SHC-113]|uniref:Lrp/AsnC family transcriptional regulator n=1 Tax=Pseudoruegeria sp. SHC-113 TaxID=2855439 RepID=UPI0021BB7BC5|nr:Lrp/AsnC family transcriptional regulator [Pseudoruegeria sp. SHC-113]MCT8161507.1 Lrp/AsnC family transcriptional regulator [Pseudoruegeria sp. SHC-113]